MFFKLLISSQKKSFTWKQFFPKCLLGKKSCKNAQSQRALCQFCTFHRSKWVSGCRNKHILTVWTRGGKARGDYLHPLFSVSGLASRNEENEEIGYSHSGHSCFWNFLWADLETGYFWKCQDEGEQGLDPVYPQPWVTQTEIRKHQSVLRCSGLLTSLRTWWKSRIFEDLMKTMYYLHCIWPNAWQMICA